MCGYCGKNYKPKRRKVQKYCCNSCRTSAFNSKKVLGLSKPEIKKPNNNQIDKMSFAGVGNAAAGTLAVNTLTSIFTKEENKPATKKDLKEIKDFLLERYHEIKNMELDSYGNVPFYDMETQTIIYLKSFKKK
jgi:hypothetical protein